MKLYNNLKDGFGNLIEGRLFVFIPYDEMVDGDKVGGYTLGASVINKRGYAFIIDASDEDKLPQCKIKNGELIYAN